MYRVIKASRQVEDTILNYISQLAEGLSKIAEAQTDEEAANICHEYIMDHSVATKAQALKAAWMNLEFQMKKYKEEAEAAENTPQVRKEVIDVVHFIGYDGYDVSDGDYIIDEVEFEDFHEVCLAIQQKLHVKDINGAALGGSWTGHHYLIDGVRVYVGYKNNRIVISFGG